MNLNIYTPKNKKDELVHLSEKTCYSYGPNKNKTTNFRIQKQ